MAPNQPTHNLTDELTMESVGDANTDTSDDEATFSMLQRSYRKGGVVPDYPDDAGTQRGPGGASGGTD